MSLEVQLLSNGAKNSKIEWLKIVLQWLLSRIAHAHLDFYFYISTWLNTPALAYVLAVAKGKGMEIIALPEFSTPMTYMVSL